MSLNLNIFLVLSVILGRVKRADKLNRPRGSGFGRDGRLVGWNEAVDSKGGGGEKGS